MSKAFTKENDSGLNSDLERTLAESDDQDDNDTDEVAVRGHYYITPEGRKKLEDELNFLWKVERPRVTHEVESAAALGDRSENAEYIYGKRRLREIDRRLRFLARRLKNLVAVSNTPDQEGRVYFGAWVTLQDDDGKLVTYRLVGADEIDLSKRWISIDSPVGRSLLGKALGDIVTVDRPRGEVEFEIMAIRYTEPV